MDRKVPVRAPMVSRSFHEQVVGRLKGSLNSACDEIVALRSQINELSKSTIPATKVYSADRNGNPKTFLLRS